MVVYDCECCKFSTTLKSNYERHLKTRKHISVTQDLPKSYPKLSFHSKNLPLITVDESLPFSCKYCEKRFKYASGVSRHIKYNCKKNKDEGLQELVRLLNEQKQNHDNDMLMMKQHNEKLQKQIETLTKKLEIKNINSNNTLNIDTLQNNNAIQNYHFNILNHNDTNYDFLTDRDYIKCIKNVNHCVKSLIETVHFNNKHPENMNIYVPSMKTDYLMVYKDNTWSIVDRKEHVDKLYELNEVQLENWYAECKDKYPDIIKSFNRYLNNKESSEILNNVKKEIIRLLYNKRQIVLDNKGENDNYVICD